MATKLGLYNGALFIIKTRKLASLTDDEKSRYTLDDIYDSTLSYMLEQGLWNHATRTVAIESSASLDPAFGYQYVFEQPTDWVRTIAISAQATFYPPLGPGEFVHEGEAFSANCDPLYLSYVSNDSGYGLDLSLWPETFARAVEYELAVRIAPHLTSMGEEAQANLEKKANRALRDARSKDALNQAGMYPPPSRLVRARTRNFNANLRRQP